jgi:hypothetical protein
MCHYKTVTDVSGIHGAISDNVLLTRRLQIVSNLFCIENTFLKQAVFDI